jgi:sigma-B regulation protein RsbU (phosphoserine phosphatase)
MSQGRAHSVLIVEDYECLASGYARALELEAYEVFLASDPEDGLRQADAHQPDVIITDFRMPHGNGFDFMTRLRARTALRRTGLVMVTGLSLDEDTRSGLEALGAYLRSKPITLEDFVAVVRACIDGRPA